MKTEVFVVCDAATESGNKLNLLGIFDIILTKSVPAVHPQCAIVIRLRLIASEQGEHKININLLEETGKNIGPPIEVPVKYVPDPKLPTGTAHCIVYLQNLRFEHFGEYSINLAVDGNQLTSIPLYIKQID